MRTVSTGNQVADQALKKLREKLYPSDDDCAPEARVDDHPTSEIGYELEEKVGTLVL